MAAGMHRHALRPTLHRAVLCSRRRLHVLSASASTYQPPRCARRTQQCVLITRCTRLQPGCPPTLTIFASVCGRWCLPRRRRVLFLSPVWPERSSSAAGVRTADLIVGFQEWGYSVSYSRWGLYRLP